ncbi:DUF2066 domain-containing protein [Psychromonas hadalis]|uniref:DUF2066 domain-containing protein n=1 Tax=Psychromonas hadalis TaxID=211669 RepID=UPI0003B50476|nr:DUF2066 domain-containing protein [Psychromonas hadalis]
MISTFFKPLLLMLIVFFSALASANLFDSPYQGNVMVGSFDEKELKEMALKQVLIKVSGNSEIVRRDESKLLLKKTQQMLAQYGYRNYQGITYFSALFDKRKINQALKEMQQPVWGETRPTTLIWLIKNNKLLSDNTIKHSNDRSLSGSLQKNEHRRGIRLQFPLMDLDDNLALSVSDVRGRFYKQVGNASSRYGLNHFVVAELKILNSEKWKLSWQLITTDKRSKQNTILVSENVTGKKSLVLSQMVNTLADYYAGQYAVLENQGEKFIQTLHINGIDSLAKLSQLNRILENLLAVSSFNILATEGALITIDVKINGGLNSFKNALIIQPHLQLDTTQRVIPEKIPEVDETETLITDAETEKTEALYFNWR